MSGTIGDAGTVSTSSTETTESTGTTETTLPPETSTTAPAETTTTLGSQGTMTISVYFTRDEKITPVHRVIPQTKEVGAAAIKALLAGPTAAEKAFGLGTNIPDGTTFLGLSIKNGVATLDLSKEYASGGGSLSMFARLAEVVYTLTQFPSVKGVQLKLDGKPVEVFGGEGLVLDHPLTRADFEDLTPAILVESPCIGDKIKSPVRIYGSANV
ncbi:MAG: GerMN domain-containing protein, partial [Thermoleophilia bacterium]|nr:GerMN domain-containing protein [Thermoleophilia bacterium]